jgi:hypothetical protein
MTYQSIAELSNALQGRYTIERELGSRKPMATSTGQSPF